MQTQENEEWLPLSEAASVTGLTIHVIKRLIKEGRVQDRENLLDKREKLVNVSQLRAIQKGD